MALGIALSFVASGCRPENLKTIPGTRPYAQDITPLPSLPPPVVQQPEPLVPTMIALPDEPGHTNWNSDTEKFKEYSVHFAFDSSVVKAADKSKVAFVAEYLKSNPQTAVRVEGNCDERGTEEYNRSLGERRALAGREELVRLGIESGRVDTLSYGEDKPVATGHNENAWKENRRDDFILLTPPAK